MTPTDDSYAFNTAVIVNGGRGLDGSGGDEGWEACFVEKTRSCPSARKPGPCAHEF